MKIKTINYELLNSTLNYRLNDKKLYLYHKGLNINNNPLDFNVDLKKLCTYGVGGTAKYLYHPKDNSELIDIVKMLTERNIKWYVIGSDLI